MFFEPFILDDILQTDRVFRLQETSIDYIRSITSLKTLLQWPFSSFRL